MSTSNGRLQAGIEAYKRGELAEAGRLVREAVRINPNNEQAWLWLSGFVDTAEQRRQCFQRVLALNPDNKVAIWGLAKLETSTLPKPVEGQPQPTAARLEPPEPEAERLPEPDPSPLEAPVEILTPFPVAVEETAEIWEEEEKGSRSRVLPFAVTLILFIALGYLAAAFVYPALVNSPASQTAVQNIKPEEETAVITTIYDNIAAGNVENIDRYMASIHSQSSNYDKTRQLLEEQYRDYDLTAVIRGVEIISYFPEEARVSFVLETHKRSGPDFRDNQIWGVFILRPEDGQWKLYDQIVNNIEYYE